MYTEEQDFYYSQTAFEEITLGSTELGGSKYVLECLIDGTWVKFTETITKGRKPASVWKDLQYVGSSKEARYTPVTQWLKERRTSQKDVQDVSLTGNEMRDFYFSEKYFKAHALGGNALENGIINDDALVCECRIDGEWKTFTEDIAKGNKPVSIFLGDLTFVGSSNETRYTKSSEWLK